MNKIDELLIHELESYGVQKAGVIAKRLNIHERTARRHIHQLKENGIISMLSVPNPVLLGYQGWAEIGIKVIPGSLDRVSSVLAEIEDIYFLAHAIGSVDIMCTTRFTTLNGLVSFISRKLSAIRGILRTEVSVLSQPRKYFNQIWPIPSIGVEINRLQHLDKIDHQIIEVLTKNPLLSIKKLKSVIGLGEATLRNRTKRLLRDGYIKTEVIPSPELIKQQAWATIGINVREGDSHKVLDGIIHNPNVYFGVVSIGQYNIILGVHYQDKNALYNFVHDWLGALKSIRSIDTHLYAKIIKYYNIVAENLTEENVN